MTDWPGDAPEGSDSATPPPFPGPLPQILAGFLVLIVLGGTIDLVLDRPRTLLSWHVAFEATMVLVSLAFGVVLFLGWRRTATTLGLARASLAETSRTLVEREAERDHWRRSAEQALEGLSRAIDRQFDSWRLSRAEREVAFRILRGVGHKQAAAQLGRSERTVRQHAVEVYRKAGLQGRAELAAFFLQDLRQPTGDPP